MKVFTAILVFITIALAPFSVASPDLNSALRLYQEKKYQEALDRFTEICKLSPNSLACCYTANCYYALGQKQEAIDLYWYVVKTFPNSKEAYTCRAFLKQIDANYAKNSYTRSSTEVPKTLTTIEKTAVSKITKETLEPDTIEKMVVTIKAQANRPDVPVELVKQVKAVLATYPVSFINLVKKNKTKVYLTPTMIDKEPGMQNTRPRGYEDGTTYKNCPGVYSYPDITVCAFTLRGADDEYWEATNDPIGTLRHELGHAFDSYLDEVSQTADFKHAYYLDCGTVDEEAKNKLSYYLQKDQGGPSETFAELFCCMYGGSTIHKEHSTLVLSAFPRCEAALKKLMLAIQ